ncbi:unnamed protein product [Closterium sp. Yama58-4]|nr:unnamed protein product [Closterium sp. Yama58-4]
MAVESLATLCVLSLIDHRGLLGYLGDMDLSLLRPVFEHCTADQLDQIENENKDRDFTPFTDDLWERCYERRCARLNFPHFPLPVRRLRASPFPPLGQSDGRDGRSKSSHVQAGSKERVAREKGGSFKEKRRVECSMDWGV